MFQVPKWRDSKVLSKESIAKLQEQIEEEEFKAQFEAQAADREKYDS
jgi:hypothetical protein